MHTRRLPKKLYKYRSFCVKSLRLLSAGEIYYANARSFNDPLDCDPTVQIDTNRSSLERLCSRMLVEKHGSEGAQKTIKELRYLSTEYGDYKTDQEAEKHYLGLLRSEIKGLIDIEMNSRGVLSLTERWDSPLMWSHYAEQHQGFCIEYAMDGNDCINLKPVDYRGPRSIKTSTLMQWKLNNSTEAQQSILDTYFFAKSREWQYEKEWRIIHRSSGVDSAPFPISSVYFGLRCDPVVRTSIVKLFANSGLGITFYDLYPLEDSFRLKRRQVEIDEIEACGVHEPPLLGFDKLT